VPGPNGASALRVAPGTPAILQDGHVRPVFSGDAGGTPSFWMRLTDAGDGPRYVITSGDADHGGGLHLFVEDGRLGATLDRRSTVRFAGTTDLADGGWQHMGLRLASAGKLSDLRAAVDGAPAPARFASLRGRLNDGQVRGVSWAAMTFGAAPAGMAPGAGGAMDLAGLSCRARALSDAELAVLGAPQARVVLSAHVRRSTRTSTRWPARPVDRRAPAGSGSRRAGRPVAREEARARPRRGLPTRGWKGMGVISRSRTRQLA